MSCGLTAGWIKMKLGIQLNLSPGHIVLDGDQYPSQKGGRAPQFAAHVCCCQMAVWIKMPLGMEVGLGPCDFLFNGDPSPPEKNGTAPTQFLAHVLWRNGWMDQDATWYTEVNLGPGHIVLDGDPAPPRMGHSSPPLFGPCLLNCCHCRPSQLLFSSCTFLSGCVLI